MLGWNPLRDPPAPRLPPPPVRRLSRYPSLRYPSLRFPSLRYPSLRYPSLRYPSLRDERPTSSR
ncbi:hypothetical protein GGH17_004889, partial [Coemansia sp. RSA 788]